MSQFLEKFNEAVWGVPMLVLILGVGLMLSICTGFAQIRLFPRAMRYFLGKLTAKEAQNGVSPMQALCTALAATVGTGNLAGVAGAIAIGGPGAVLWMWVSGILGMITKMAEATLSVRYRVCRDGEYFGGPMHIIRAGLGKRWHFLAYFYAFFCVVAALGVGNATQVNAVVSGINAVLLSRGVAPSLGKNFLIGLSLAMLIGTILWGGAKRIGSMAERLVPFAAFAYLLLGILVLIARFQAIPGAIYSIFEGAFSPRAVTGGVIGSFLTTLRIGVSRGVFTNEAGMGTAGIAHAGADVAHPAEQGLLGIVEVFLDTIVICTMTALVILVSGVEIPFGTDPGASLTTLAFTAVCGDWAAVVIAGALCCFAIATILGWGLYGQRCAQFLFGDEVWREFALLQAAAVVLGAVGNTGVVWLLAEIVNGLMAVPNLIALVALMPEFLRLVREFSGKKGRQLM